MAQRCYIKRRYYYFFSMLWKLKGKQHESQGVSSYSTAEDTHQFTQRRWSWMYAVVCFTNTWLQKRRLTDAREGKHLIQDKQVKEDGAWGAAALALALWGEAGAAPCRTWLSPTNSPQGTDVRRGHFVVSFCLCFSLPKPTSTVNKLN